MSINVLLPGGIFNDDFSFNVSYCYDQLYEMKVTVILK